MMFLEIAVAAPIDKTLTYRLVDSPGLKGENPVGRRVLVPLGRRRVTGYVLKVVDSYKGDFQLRDIIEFLDNKAVFHENLIPLFLWAAKYYHYPIGEVIRSALPAGFSPRSVKTLALVENKRDLFYQQMGELENELAEKLYTKGGLSGTETKKLLSQKRVQKKIRKWVEDGVLLLTDSMIHDAVKEKHEKCYGVTGKLPEVFGADEPPDRGFVKRYSKEIQAFSHRELKLSETKTLYYLQKLSRQNGSELVPRKEITSVYSGASGTLSALIQSGLVKEKERRVFRSPFGEQLQKDPVPDSLTKEQRDVLSELTPAITSKQYHPFLLHGVTGSGKTEIYLQSAAACLAEGRDVIVIAPEIAIATQLETHFVSRFGEQVVLLHSGLTKTERFDQWSLALSGMAKIVIGARSAVFAPLRDPGLIVVDEEHDTSLKQDDGLRYNGRDLAVVRAKLQQSVVLLGSATPSIVSYHNVLTEKYRLLTLRHRVGRRPLPHVTIVDLRNSPAGERKSLFQPQLRDAIRKNLENSCQSVILLNRRGFASSVICRECGAPVQCAHCHVSLTQHQSAQKLLCHYCGYSVHSQTVCSACGSMSMVPVGIGTERVEEELRALFEEATIARLDTDTARDRKTFLRIIKEMRNGDVDILVGTQMVAKGLHFPGVTLVGVVFADGGLSIPDYRAAEKTFQLVTQVTGRAGRGEGHGEVYIQTLRPEHYAIQFAKSHQYREMVEHELGLRKNPAYPPYVRIVALHIQGEKENTVRNCAARVADECRRVSGGKGGSVEVLGPAPAPIDRIKNTYRWQLLLKSADIEALHSLCSFLHSAQADLRYGKCRIMIDVDPENLM